MLSGGRDPETGDGCSRVNAPWPAHAVRERKVVDPLPACCGDPSEWRTWSWSDCRPLILNRETKVYDDDPMTSIQESKNEVVHKHDMVPIEVNLLRADLLKVAEGLAQTEENMEMLQQETVYSQEAINDVFRLHFSTCYAPPPSTHVRDIDTYLTWVTVLVLSPEARKTLDHSLTEEDLASVIHFLKTLKTPGNDGFLAEFYHKYANILSERLLEVFEESLILSRLPPIMREALIIMVPKPNKDPSVQLAYPPISLLC
ncbi:hypothetical protein NDU88_002289 [Pleurodeles waltl]|uniref:Uncharacterized protein n=1 Tax=Pleurodeles waltl TaxID=8319 RepID=A0AAV7LDD5_PLEWA|nr:hypothetical protein NDU88_002289 [Pleurodeles waltl]